MIGAAAAAVVIVGGGGTAFAMDQRVTLDVNGEQQTVHTFGTTVQDVLDTAGVTLGEHDAVAPETDAEVARGGSVLVRTARELTLEIDGEPESHWVTALTVGEGLDQLGMGGEALELSVDRDEAIPEEGLAVEAASALRVVILRDRVRMEADTTADTVEQVLADNGITPGEHDIVEPELDTEPTDGMVIDVTELLSEPTTEEVPIEAETEERENPDLPEGEENVVQEPEDGVQEVTTAMVMREGEETEYVIKEEVIKEAVDGITEIGTKVEDAASGEASSLNWAALAECESGGDPTAVNSAGGYYGLYQFSMATWQSAGGSGSPAEASADEQTMRAQKLYDMVNGNWQGQWPECGVHLFD
ncbi:ubiquitin-like domain-containing protein [Nocardiopsis sediminis]|uniref:Ubiquitin-like domain-containing protein n=1 Tax=Nocardiopsis sediminis TaxID=1778267 RepID=A0ABV8FIA9_9ACTN